MKLVNKDYNLEFETEENKITVLSIENATAYTKMVGDIWRQINGEDGGFILSDAGKVRNISKEVECIFNPFALNCNNKKVISKLYQELKEQSDNMLQEETAEINSRFILYLEQLLMTVPYSLKYNCDIDVLGIVKLYGVEVDNHAEGVLESIVEYVNVMSQLCGINTFVFVDLKHYLSKNQLIELYENVIYKKINLIILEPIQTSKLDTEKSWIIDKDLCIINL